MIKRLVYTKNIFKILNVYMLSNIANRCMKKKMRELNSETDKSTIIIGQLKPPHQDKQVDQ